MSDGVRAGLTAQLAAAALLLMLGGCGHRAAVRPGASSHGATAPASAPKSDHRYAQDQDSGPSGPPPDISKIPEPVPHAEPRSVYGNKSPYDVLGQTYTVLPNGRGYVERGVASW